MEKQVLRFAQDDSNKSKGNGKRNENRGSSLRMTARRNCKGNGNSKRDGFFGGGWLGCGGGLGGEGAFLEGFEGFLGEGAFVEEEFGGADAWVGVEPMLEDVVV